LAAADLCVLPFRDGVSLLHGTLHAALAHGATIVSSLPRVALPELVHGQNIYLVPPEDPSALADALAALAGDGALRRRLGQGAEILSSQFRWDRIAARTLELYHSLGARN
jgi:glycosyltransferase involved in cell wall biosynthesis